MNLRSEIESTRKMFAEVDENFISIGNLLYKMKSENLFRIIGYERFKGFVEEELNITSARANKLVRIYQTFLIDMGMYDVDILEIGYDKISLILPMMNKKRYGYTNQEWVDMARDLDIAELRTAIKEAKDAIKEEDFKKVFAKQTEEKLCQFIGCTKNMLTYNLGFFFQEVDLVEVASYIKKKRLAFEEEILSANKEI